MASYASFDTLPKPHLKAIDRYLQGDHFLRFWGILRVRTTKLLAATSRWRCDSIKLQERLRITSVATCERCMVRAPSSPSRSVESTCIEQKNNNGVNKVGHAATACPDDRAGGLLTQYNNPRTTTTETYRILLTHIDYTAI